MYTKQNHRARRAVTALAVVLTGLGAAVAAVGTVSAQGGAGGGGTGGGGGGGVIAGTATGADLQLTGSASTNSPDPGAVYTYTFQIKNSGGATADSVVFTDPNPVGARPNYATMNGSTLPCFNVGDPTGGSSVQCNVGSLAKGAGATIVVSVTAPRVAASVTDTGTVSSTTADPNPANNSKTVTVTVKAPTGSLCKGGSCDVTPVLVVGVPCATLTSVSAPVGYYTTFAAIWNTFTIQSCSAGSEALTVQVQEINVATGSVDYDLTYPLGLVAGQNTGLVLDNDFAGYSTTYNIVFTVRDSSGVVLDTQSVVATTPGPL